MKNQQTHITRFLIIVAMALIGCYIGLTPGWTAGSAGNATPPLPSLRGEEAIGHLKQTGLYHELSAAVIAARYQMDERKAGGYEASNPEQGYRTIFTREGVELRGASGRGPGWRVGMELTGYGYGERKRAVTSAGLKASDARIEYERRTGEGDGLMEWYVNRAEGLEQGFTIRQAPGKRRGGEKLNLWLKLSGDLQARPAESGRAILLNGRGAGAGLRYEKLQAFDALGRELEARMKVAGDEVKLEVGEEGAIYPVTIEPTFTQQQQLQAPDTLECDFSSFGFSVAISGETVVVGALSNNGTGDMDQGAAYVFVRSGGGWTQQQKLTASDAEEFDYFGRSVAINGETIVVGAANDDRPFVGLDVGSAYVFVRSGGVWSQQQKLEASDGGEWDYFGGSVAISGETVVVGAPEDDVWPVSDQGAAYVFVRSGGVWSQQQKLKASDAARGEFFGDSVAISGETIVVGASFNDGVGGVAQGSAYVFVRSDGVWSQQQKLDAPDAGAFDNFGASVAINGETIVVGAFDVIGAYTDEGAPGSAYVFVRSGGVWSQQQKLEASDVAQGDRFGVSVAINGETVVVGASGDDDAELFNRGSAYVFVRSGGVWTQQQKLLVSDMGRSAEIGFSVAISGETVVVGAPNDRFVEDNPQGSAYVFVPVN